MENNKHVDRAYTMSNLSVDIESIEGLNIMLQAVTESNLAIAHEARLANEIAFLKLRMQVIPSDIDIAWANPELRRIREELGKK